MRVGIKFKALVAMLAVAVIVPVTLVAWGPSRPTYTIEHPADHITFNSITNNPNIGDERNFVGIREVGSQNVWYDDVNVQPGKSYIVRMYVHNNAAQDLNLVAENVTAKFNLPTTTGKSIEVNGFINSTNASPQEVYDHATFKSDKDFNLAYQANTLKFENNVFGPNGTALPESIFTSAGAKLGYDKLDGKIPGCFQFDGYVTFVVKPQFGAVPTFEMNKQVRKSGETAWSKSVAANPGDTVDFQLDYKNTSEAQQNNVWFQDVLPAGLNYVEGSSFIKNGNNPNGLKLPDTLTKPEGVNVGDYLPAATAYVKFSAKVGDDDQMTCGTNKLVNKGSVTVAGGAKDSTAEVVVTKPCAPGQIQVCDLTTKQVITINENEFDSSKHSKNLDDCKQPCVENPKAGVTCELPQTGIEGFAGFLGLGALTAGGSYFIRSLRARRSMFGE